MTANWQVQQEITVVSRLDPTAVADATPVACADFDVRAFAPGSRFMLALSAFETNVANTGGVWTVQESATDGGSYTASTIGGTLTATPAAAGTDLQWVAVFPNPAKPFVQAVFTGADANTEVTILVTLIVIPRAL